MKTIEKKKRELRRRRVWRVRKRLKGVASKPRLCIVKSNTHLYAQLIDDEAGKTLGAISTISREFRGTEFNRKHRKSARKLGERIAEIAVGLGIDRVVFDRGSSKYTGILAEFAESARNAGLKF